MAPPVLPPEPEQPAPPVPPDPMPEKKAKKIEESLPEGEFLKMFPDARPD
jgi:hypothetical protein